MSEREIFCDECGDCAVEVDQGALGEDLDGVHVACQSCNVDGKIVFTDDADEDGAYTRLSFRKMTEDEESELAALACDGKTEDELDAELLSIGADPEGITQRCMSLVRDEVELEVDRMFQPTDLSELATLLIKDGWFDGPGLVKCGPKKSDLPN